jgi:hypothetical protein
MTRRAMVELTELTEVKVKVTLRLTVGQSVSQSVCPDVEPLVVLMTRCYC